MSILMSYRMEDISNKISRHIRATADPFIYHPEWESLYSLMFTFAVFKPLLDTSALDEGEYKYRYDLEKWL